MDQRKIVIVGTGSVGATLAYTLVQDPVADTVVLVDANSDLAEGHALDLNHGMSFLSPTTVLSGDLSECRNADIVVITAGRAQMPGENRFDLVRNNADLYRELIPEIASHEPGILIIVTNPVDVLTYTAMKLSGYDPSRVIGSGTVLDTSRFRYQISRHSGVDPRNVHAYIVGEHGDSEVPIWSKANIAGILVRDYYSRLGIDVSREELNEIFEQVKNAAYTIIDKKGHTSFAVSLALHRIISSILRDGNSVLTVSTLVQGYLDIRDVCLSMPCLVNRNGAVRILPLELSDEETRQLKHSASIIREEIEKTGV